MNEPSLSKILPLHAEFQSCIDRQPYTVILNGLRLDVDRDVFPPDLGRCAQNLAQTATGYTPQTALDMGCGTGYLALMLHRQGVPHVWASDVHPPAVACAQKNIQRNVPWASIKLVQSDLFANLPEGLRFDLIIFNQPFGPGRGDTVCGCGPDGGLEITRRFLMQVPGHLQPGAVILMPFSDRVSAVHSPEPVARQLGFSVTTLIQQHYNDSENFIFEIRQR